MSFLYGDARAKFNRNLLKCVNSLTLPSLL